MPICPISEQPFDVSPEDPQYFTARSARTVALADIKDALNTLILLGLCCI